MRIAFKVVSLLALLFGIVWTVRHPAFDSGGFTILALAGAIASFIAGKEKSSPTQEQRVAEGGVGIQAGRDVIDPSVNVKR